MSTAFSGDTPEPPGGVTVWFNPNCSKCRTVQGILAERGIDANYVRYLEQAPSRAEIEAVLTQLGTDDPRAIMRTGEAVYTELSLAGADRDALLEAVVANPILRSRIPAVSPMLMVMAPRKCPSSGRPSKCSPHCGHCSSIFHQLVKMWPAPQRGQCLRAARPSMTGTLGRSEPAMSVGFSSP